MKDLWTEAIEQRLKRVFRGVTFVVREVPDPVTLCASTLQIRSLGPGPDPDERQIKRAVAVAMRHANELNYALNRKASWQVKQLERLGALPCPEDRPLPQTSERFTKTESHTEN